ERHSSTSSTGHRAGAWGLQRGRLATFPPARPKLKRKAWGRGHGIAVIRTLLPTWARVQAQGVNHGGAKPAGMAGGAGRGQRRYEAIHFSIDDTGPRACG